MKSDLEASASELLDEYKDRLMVQALGLCRDAAEAEDLVMRTFEVYFFKRDRYDPRRGSLLAWLRTVMRNLQTDSNRRRKVPEVVLPPENVERVSDAQTAAGFQNRDDRAEEDERLVSEAVNALSPKLREAVVLHYFESLPVVQVARILCASEDSVKNRLFCARKVLAKRLRNKIGKGGVVAVLAVFAALVSVAAVATLPAFAPVRAAVAARLSGTPSGAVQGEAPAVPAAPAVPGTAPETFCPQPAQEVQPMKLAKPLAAAALAVTAAVVAVETEGATLVVDQIKQRYPWNGLVDVDYTIAGDDGAPPGVDDNLEMLMVDSSSAPAVTNRAITFLQAPLPLTAGRHRITWDAHADGVTSRTDNATFIVKIAHYGPVYMVIDVSGGPTATTYPVEFLNGAPQDEFGVDEYKSDKIVLRRIHPGSYVAGSPEDEANRNGSGGEKQHRVALSKPFYVGIYEVTQQQYLNVMGGANPSAYQGDCWRCRPVEQVSYSTIRGGNWPAEAAPRWDGFMGLLNSRCKARDDAGNYTVRVDGFDLPTEFQWEYACRAGTTGAFNTTNEFANTTEGQQTALASLGRSNGSQADGRGGISENHTVVGSYAPNQWGLYDMHGNVQEWCRDRFQADVAALKQFVDPAGAGSGDERVKRGGGWGNEARYCRSAERGGFDPASSRAVIGFRLSRTLP
ncbi:MAG: sigma-70 family RNA polymerase sigma factor [Kiritimatiellae bacterium]|nr:sigma-70 family RNA polymerase sigma factor [Kiritimatiellia bacterium]